jgi:Protein of unknown function (DUF3551)
MRYLFGAILLTGLLTGSGASAQYMHHRFCLQTGASEECAFDTLSQCRASMHSERDTCVRNSAPINHAR